MSRFSILKKYNLFRKFSTLRKLCFQCFRADLTSHSKISNPLVTTFSTLRNDENNKFTQLKNGFYFERFAHIPVLLKEVVDAYETTEMKIAIDLTFGLGSHSRAILRTGVLSRLICCDRDPHAFECALKFQLENRSIVSPIKCRFGELDAVLKELDVESHSVDFILMDLGCSSMQLDDDERGFSLSREARLDMRMDNNDTSVTAYDVVNKLGDAELCDIFKKYGEVREARKIASTIVDYRLTVGPIVTTRQLADIVLKTVVRKQYTDSMSRFSHPATLVFQALRIFVNDELNELYRVLRLARQILRPESGRLVVIGFHSLEDRLVKWTLSNRDGGGHSCSGGKYAWRQVGAVITPSEEEISRNPRSRSAKLRIGQMIKSQ